MDWREAAAGGLPAPRNDEPAGLRQDILDELADHLDCALARELAKNITPEEAIANVKRRFGDPRDLARQLWVDAMKDAIMSKRLTLAAMGLMFVMCLLIGWMAWTSQRASQEAAESIRKTNSELLEKLTTLLARPAPGAAAERMPVHFHLVRDDAQKSPARGYEGTLHLAGSGSSLNAIKRTAGEDGNLDFGMLPAGSYRLKVWTPWQETTQVFFDIAPGFPSSSFITCPAQDWPKVTVSFDFAGLPSLKDRDALIICRISAATSRQIEPGGFGWTHEQLGQQPEGFYVVLNPTGRIVFFGRVPSDEDPRGQLNWRELPAHRGNGGFGRRAGSPFQVLAPTEQFAWLADGLKQKPQVNFRERKYELKWIMVILCTDIRRVAGQSAQPSKLPYTLPTWKAGRTPYAFTVSLSGSTEAPALQPVAGQDNVWKIRVASDFADELNKLLLSSASRIPQAENAAGAHIESKGGAELLKTLGIGSAVPERENDLTGMRLGALGDNLPAKQAGLENGDLLLGVEGWNVNNERELGRASGFPASPMGRAVLWRPLLALVRRGTEILLYKITPPGSPSPDSAAPPKATAPAKASGPSSSGGRGLDHGRMPIGS